MTRVLIMGATGRVGKELVARLSSKGLQTRICLRGGNEHKKASWLKNLGACEIVDFDLTKKETWEPAMDKVDVLFSSSLDPLITEHMEFIKTLNVEQVKHIVRISCFGADDMTALNDPAIHVSAKDSKIPIMLQHYWWAEEVCYKSGIPTTAIRGNFYMNHLLKNETESIKKNGFFTSPLGECKNSFVSTNDMAEASAVCILEGPERHGNKAYDITGPEPHSMHDVAAILSSVMNEEIVYKPQDLVKFREDFGAARAEFFEYLRNGFYSRASPDFYNLTGRRPTTYREYLTTKGAAGETGLEELWQKGMFEKGKDLFKDLDKVNKL